MANHRAIAATSAALLGLIRDRYPREDFGTGLEVHLYQSRDFESPMQDGFSIYLYRVGINGTMRSLSQRRAPDGRRYRASLPLDLYYLVTPWARDAERQHRMLGWAMRMLEDVGVLGAGHLNHYLPEDDTFGQAEGVEIVCDPLAFSDYLTLWDRLRPRLPASATYALRMVLLDSAVPVTEDRPVQTRRLEMLDGVPVHAGAFG
jgi:hypothetical protein